MALFVGFVITVVGFAVGIYKKSPASVEFYTVDVFFLSRVPETSLKEVFSVWGLAGWYALCEIAAIGAGIYNLV